MTSEIVEPMGDEVASMQDFSLSVKRIADFVESSYAENYNCSLFDEDSVWGVLLLECHVPNTINARKACYASYVSHLQQVVSIAERCYPFVPSKKPIQDDMAHPIPPKCGCRYIPSNLQDRCRTIGHTHCPMCRLVVPYSLAHWQFHVIDICSLPREEHLILNIKSGAIFDPSSSGSVIPVSTTSNQSKLHVCFVCTKLFQDVSRLKRHFVLNHVMESEIDFKVAHQIDPIRGVYAVINYGDFAVQVSYFIKQFNCIKCYVCPSSEKMRNCGHFIAVLQNSYPVEEYTIPESALTHLPLDVVTRFRNFEALANRMAVPAIVALKTPPHVETTLFSVMDEENFLKRYTVVVLASKKAVCSCASQTRTHCWHRLLVNLTSSDPNRVSKCCFNLTEMKTFLNNCKLSVSKSTILAYLDKVGTPIEDAGKLVMQRLNYEIDMLQEEAHLLRRARIERYGEYVPPEEKLCHETNEISELANHAEAVDVAEQVFSEKVTGESQEASEASQDATSADANVESQALESHLVVDEGQQYETERPKTRKRAELERLVEKTAISSDDNAVVETRSSKSDEIVSSSADEGESSADEKLLNVNAKGSESSDNQTTTDSPLRRSKRTATVSSLESGSSPSPKKPTKL